MNFPLFIIDQKHGFEKQGHKYILQENPPNELD